MWFINEVISKHALNVFQALRKLIRKDSWELYTYALKIMM